MKRIFVCSKLSGEFQKNLHYAKLFCKIVSKMGHAPYAPHVLCTTFLDEKSMSDREAGISIGLEFLSVCNELWVFKRDSEEHTSSGMKREIIKAIELGIPVKTIIVTMNEKTAKLEFLDVGEIWIPILKGVPHTLQL